MSQVKTYTIIQDEKLKEEVNKIRLTHYSKLREVDSVTIAGMQGLYMYKSLAIKEAYDKRLKQKHEKIHEYHPEYTPDFTQFQYDLELFIFLNWEYLYRREIQLSDLKREKLLLATGPGLGCTFFERTKHLEKAISIRWPEKELPDGSVSTAFALTPWSKDYVMGLSNYNNIITFGGGGQGKTYTALAFMVMMYDHFIYTKSGAQCSFSTVSQTKLEASAWSHVNKLYSFRNPYKFSLYAGKALIGPDYTYARKDIKGKKWVEEGGTLKGILLVKGAKSAVQVDKLTGQHDVNLRIYLLDEAQSTSDAPMSAYNNMFLHVPHGWFLMAGNYDLDEDLLGVNTIPDTPGGWEDVDENTHMWESSLRSFESNLGHRSLVIHYNNNLSPAILDKNIYRRYNRFMPTEEKKKKLYPTKEQENTIAAKRFWVGFRYEKEEAGKRYPVITTPILKAFNAYDNKKINTLFRMAAADTAPADNDRDVITIFDVGLCDKGYIEIAPHKIVNIPKPDNQFEYYRKTAKAMFDVLTSYGVKSGHAIMDWTQRPQLLESLKYDYNFVFHHMIYGEKPPKERGLNRITKVMERPIEMESVPTFQGELEKEVKTFAHERFYDNVTTAAYIFRLFVEFGRFKGINPSILEGVAGHKGFDREMCSRYINLIKRGSSLSEKMAMISKREFHAIYKFSPDIMDTFLEVSYMLYVIFGIRANVRGLGTLSAKKENKTVDNSIWESRMRFHRPR